MSYDLVRLAIRKLPPPLALDDPKGPYEHERLRLDLRNGDPWFFETVKAEALDERTAERYVRAVQGWLMAVRWRTAAQGEPSRGLPFQEWKRIFRPWLEALTTESTFLAKDVRWDAWKLLVSYMHTVASGDGLEHLGTRTLEEMRELEASHFTRLVEDKQHQD